MFRLQRELLVMTTIVLCSCGGQVWTSEEQDQFLTECKEEGGSRSYCSCYLEKVMEKYPSAADSKKMDFETAVELASECE
jgi:hypothetical protein